MKDKREELTNKKIIPLMFRLGIPGIVGMFVISLYSFVDAAFVGQFAENGKIALGAISTAYTFTLINNGIAVLVGIGAASLLARAVGRKDQKVVDSVMSTVLFLSIGLSLISTLIGYFGAPYLLSLINVEGQMQRLATQYLKIVFLSSLAVNFGQASNMVLRGQGKVGTAMLIMCSGAVLNIVLDAYFIIYLKMGLEGAAIATVIAQVFFALLSFFYILFFNKEASFNKFRLEKSIVPEIFAVGFSAMIMQVLALLQQAIMYSTLKKYGGEDEVIIMGGFFRYIMLTFIPLWGLSQGFQPFVGTNFGAGLFKRVKQGTLAFHIFGFILVLIGYIVFFTSPETVLSLFIKDASLIASGKLNTMLSYSLFLIVPFIILNITLFQALGNAKAAGILALSRQFVFFVPLCLILPIFFGVRGVYLSMPVADSIVFLLSLFFMIKAFNKDLKEAKS